MARASISGTMPVSPLPVSMTDLRRAGACDQEHHPGRPCRPRQVPLGERPARYFLEGSSAATCRPTTRMAMGTPRGARRLPRGPAKRRQRGSC